MSMTDYKYRIWFYLAGVMLVVAVLFTLYGVFNKVDGFSIKWNEDFEDLTLGNIDGQGYWETQGQTYWSVSGSSPLNGTKGLRIQWDEASYKTAVPLFNPNDIIDTEKSFEMWVKPFKDADPSNSIFHFRDSLGQIKFGFMLVRVDVGLFKVGNTIGTDINPAKRISLNNWAKITLTFYPDHYSIDVYTNGENWDTYIGALSVGLPNISQMSMECFDCGIYVDDMFYQTPIANVWGDTPVSGTEITGLEDILTIGYVGLDYYDSLYVALRHPQTGIFTDAKRYDIIDIGGLGQLEIPLTHFNIEKNGNWYLHAVATYEGYQYEDELFLSSYGWNWTDDLTDGSYYLDINIEGFEEMFAMSDFETWYSDNAKFDTPTEMFSDIASVFSPIFSTIGEFGNRIKDYFDVDSAYSKGFEIGKAIPVFSYYVGQISYFLGGFPAITWLLIVILVLVGIFIFRIIMKFIPFLG